MKLFSLLPLAILLVGCSPTDDPNAPVVRKQSANGGSKESFGDEKFLVARYPGAEPIPHSATQVDSPQSHGYNREYKSKDPIDKISDFYKKEGAKFGTINESNPDPAPGVKTVMVRRDNGDQIFVQAATMTDGTSKIIIHYIIPKPGGRKGRMGGAMSMDGAPAGGGPSTSATTDSVPAPNK